MRTNEGQISVEINKDNLFDKNKFESQDDIIDDPFYDEVVNGEKNDKLQNREKKHKHKRKMEKICYKVTNEEQMEFQRQIDKIVTSDQVFIVEMDEFEKLHFYTDKYPLLNLRKEIIWLKIFISFVCYKIIKDKLFDIFILLVILCNSIILCISDPTTENDGKIIDTFELIFLVIYTIEMSLKILGLGFVRKKGSYLRDYWNMLDFVIVVTAYIPYVITSSQVNLSILRTIRILRPLRTISNIQSLKILLSALFESLPMLCDTFMILMFVFLIFAILGLQLFMGDLKQRCFVSETGIAVINDDGQEVFCGGTCSQNQTCGKMIQNPNLGITNFDNFLYSMLQVFQITTLEGWTQIQDWIRITTGDYAIFFFVLLVFLGNFFVMNMMLAVIKAKFSEAHDASDRQSEQDKKAIQKNKKQLKDKEFSSENSEDEDGPFEYTFKQLQQFPRYQEYFLQKRTQRQKQSLEAQKSYQSMNNSQIQKQYQEDQDQYSRKDIQESFIPLSKTENLPLECSFSEKQQLENLQFNNFTPENRSELNQQVMTQQLDSAERIIINENGKYVKFKLLQTKQNSDEKTNQVQQQKVLLNNSKHREILLSNMDNEVIDLRQIVNNNGSLVQKNNFEPQNNSNKNYLSDEDKIKAKKLITNSKKKSKKIEKQNSLVSEQNENLAIGKTLQTQMTINNFENNIINQNLININNNDYLDQDYEDLKPIDIPNQDVYDFDKPFEKNLVKAQAIILKESLNKVPDLSYLHNIQMDKFREIQKKHFSLEDEIDLVENIEGQILKDFKQGGCVSESDISECGGCDSSDDEKGKKFKFEVESQKDGIKQMSFHRAKELVEQKPAFENKYNYEKLSKISPPKQYQPKKIYESILDYEFSTGVIVRKNWSAKNVWINAQEKPRQHVNKIIQSMNQLDDKIWIQGAEGIVIAFRKFLINLIENQWFENLILFSVLANTVVLAMDGFFDDDKNAQNALDNLNYTFTIIFTVELGLKLIAYGIRGYLRDTMNIFDGLIVIISWVEIIFFSGGAKAVSAFRSVRIFRAFRVLRVTKLLRALAFMKVIIGVVSRALSSFVYIALLLSLFIFIYALLGRQFFSGKLNIEGMDLLRTNWDTLQSAFVTTFQILTLENWQTILFYTMKSDNELVLTIFYLFSWIFIGNFTLLNLFLAILLDGFSSESAERDYEEAENAVDDDEVVEENQQVKLVNVKEKGKNDDSFDLQDIEEILDDISGEAKKDQKIRLYNALGSYESVFLFKKTNIIRKLTFRIVQWNRFEDIILFLIVLSSIKLAFDSYLPNKPETSTDELLQKISKGLDIGFNVCFIVEALLKIISYGFVLEKLSYLRDSWNQMDFIIVLSSIIDMAVTSVDLEVVKILRLMRTLRPLRFISHNVNMKIVVTSLMSSTGAITNVLIVIFFVYIMFSILGMSFMSKKMGYCDIPKYYQIPKEYCVNVLNAKWVNRDVNFDNIYTSFISLFIFGSLEGWPDLMYKCIDGDDSSVGPSLNNQSVLSLYFVFFILVVSFFFLNLFVGAICYHFDKCHKSEKSTMYSYLTEEQNNWIEIQKLILKAKPDLSSFFVPANKYRMKLYQVVTSNMFDLVIMICILLNILSMALVWEQQSPGYKPVLDAINYFFTVVFIIEASLKIIALSFKGYWISNWNRFDLFVVIASILDIGLTIFNSGTAGSNFLRVGPQLARIIRILRVSRLLKLVKSFQGISSYKSIFLGLQKVIETMVISLPSLFNVGALIVLVMFIYSILGVFLFKEVTDGQEVTIYTNFWNFHNAFITLFRCATGEDWFLIMFDVGKTDSSCIQGQTCGSAFSVPYFITYILLTTFVMLNLFILIILNDFEEYNLKEDNPVEKFKENLESFRNSWSTYTKDTNGKKITEHNLLKFFQTLNPPLGFGQNSKQNDIAKCIMKMQLKCDPQGYIFFNELLFASMKRIFGEKVAQNTRKEIMTYIAFEELWLKKEIRTLTYNQNKKDYQNLNNKTNLNPFFVITFVRMSFQAWYRYSSYVKENQKNPLDKTASKNFKYPKNNFDSQSSDSGEENGIIQIQQHPQVDNPYNSQNLNQIDQNPQNQVILPDSKSEPDPEDFSMFNQDMDNQNNTLYMKQKQLLEEQNFEIDIQ